MGWGGDRNGEWGGSKGKCGGSEGELGGSKGGQGMEVEEVSGDYGIRVEIEGRIKIGR